MWVFFSYGRAPTDFWSANYMAIILLKSATSSVYLTSSTLFIQLNQHMKKRHSQSSINTHTTNTKRRKTSGHWSKFLLQLTFFWTCDKKRNFTDAPVLLLLLVLRGLMAMASFLEGKGGFRQKMIWWQGGGKRKLTSWQENGGRCGECPNQICRKIKTISPLKTAQPARLLVSHWQLLDRLLVAIQTTSPTLCKRACQILLCDFFAKTKIQNWGYLPS